MAQLRDRRRNGRSALRGSPPEAVLSGKLRQKTRNDNEDENSGVEALSTGEAVTEAAVRKAGGVPRGNTKEPAETHASDNAETSGNRWQRRRYQEESASGRMAGTAEPDRYVAEDPRTCSIDDTSTSTRGQFGTRSTGQANTAGSGASGGGASPSGSIEDMAGGATEGIVDPSGGSNAMSRWRQRYDIKRQYAVTRSGGAAGSGAGAGAGATGSAGSEGAASGGGSILSKATDSAKQVGENAAQFVAEHWSILLVIGVVLILILMLSTVMTSCSSVGTGGGDVIVGTSYTAPDDDILGAEEDYIALEEALNQQIIEVRSHHPGYDEYRFDLDEIGHDPYQLAAILTILKEDYTREEVQELLQEILDLQYEIELTPSSETRHHSDENHTAYEWRILTIRLKNKGLDHVVEELDLEEDRLQRYEVIYELKGNRTYLFADDLYTNPGSTLEEYEVPGDALTDEKFANMMAEAEKYIGVSYVWGGYSPSGFDCSGFVSYVINHCGNGWSYGHQTTWGLESITTMVSASEAQPGDLVFFQGTYNTTGPSHVGIYVGNGMMLHCGNPVHYSSIETSYWQEHLRGFGRLP